jgi:hypothetical protein
MCFSVAESGSLWLVIVHRVLFSQAALRLTEARLSKLFLNPSLFAICTKCNKQMAWFIDRDGGEESSVAQ